MNIDKYGLGTERSLEDYYNFAGIDKENKKVEKNFCNNVYTDYTPGTVFVSKTNTSTNVVVVGFVVIVLFVILYCILFKYGRNLKLFGA
jgi:hypothetical protein